MPSSTAYTHSQQSTNPNDHDLYLFNTSYASFLSSVFMFGRSYSYHTCIFSEHNGFSLSLSHLPISLISNALDSDFLSSHFAFLCKFVGTIVCEVWLVLPPEWRLGRQDSHKARRAVPVVNKKEHPFSKEYRAARQARRAETSACNTCKAAQRYLDLFSVPHTRRRRTTRVIFTLTRNDLPLWHSWCGKLFASLELDGLDFASDCIEHKAQARKVHNLIRSMHALPRSTCEPSTQSALGQLTRAVVTRGGRADRDRFSAAEYQECVGAYAWPAMSASSVSKSTPSRHHVLVLPWLGVVLTAVWCVHGVQGPLTWGRVMETVAEGQVKKPTVTVKSSRLSRDRYRSQASNPRTQRHYKLQYFTELLAQHLVKERLLQPLPRLALATLVTCMYCFTVDDERKKKKSWYTLQIPSLDVCSLFLSNFVYKIANVIDSSARYNVL